MDDSIIYDQRRRTFEEKIRHHTIPQTHPFNCLHLAEFVGRYEQFDDDFAVIGERVGISVTPPKMHTTTPTLWSDVLTGKTLERCIEYYKKDFEVVIEDEILQVYGIVNRVTLLFFGIFRCCRARKGAVR